MDIGMGLLNRAIDDDTYQGGHASKSGKTQIRIERVLQPLTRSDLNDLCDATDAAILAGGGFGWVRLPQREVMERFWQGVMAMPIRMLLVARLDGVIAGSLQLVRPAPNNEAQNFAVQVIHHFVAPWARGYGLARALLDHAENLVAEEGFEVINLDVRATQEAAMRLYESQGYQLIGVHPAYARVKGRLVEGRYYFKKLSKP